MTLCRNGCTTVPPWGTFVTDGREKASPLLSVVLVPSKAGGRRAVEDTSVQLTVLPAMGLPLASVTLTTMGLKKRVLGLREQTGQINCPLPETTATLAAVAADAAGAVACADAAGTKSSVITNAVINVDVILSKTTSWFTGERGWKFGWRSEEHT